MRKEEAAKFLGISVRTLELYTQQSRIGGHYEKGKTRPVLVYDDAEVERFKEELEGQSYLHRPVVERAPRPVPSGASNREALGNAGGRGNAAASFGESVPFLPNADQSGDAKALALQGLMPPQMEQLLTALIALGAQGGGARPGAEPTVPIEHKLFLSLDEAQSFTGLSRGILQKAIKAKQLPAKIMGRGWRIRRADLEAYAAQMSME